MTRPGVPEMVEMLEQNNSLRISYSETNNSNDEIQPADSPPLLRPPSLPNIFDPDPIPSPTPRIVSTLRRKRKSNQLPGQQVPISQMTVDVDETRLDKLDKVMKLVKEILFYPFLYTTRGIEVKFGKATASYFMLLLRFLLLNLICLLLNAIVWIPRLVTLSGNTTVYEIGPGLQGITALITGKGLEFTALFMGNYTGDISGDLFFEDGAYFTVFFAITFVILVFLAYWLGQAYLKTVSLQSTYTSVERFIFLGWDYSIDDSLQGVLKQQSNYIALKELLQELSDKPTVGGDMRNNSYVKLAVRWSLWGLGWGITLFLLLCGASLIVCTGQQRYRTTGGGDLNPIVLVGFVPSMWHTFLEVAFPIVILLEGYKVKANLLNALLFKYLLMRLVSLFAICLLITQSYVLSKAPAGGNCSFIPFEFCITANSCNLDEIVNYECWETQAGRILYEYILAQFISSIIFRSFVLVVQNLIRKSINFGFRVVPGCKNLSPRIHKVFEYALRSEFHVSKHVMKIIYIQCLIWCGMLFSPFITLIGFLGFLILYFTMIIVTKLTSQHSPPPPRISKSNLSYYGILVFMFLIIMLLLHWPIFFFEPSENCGPFRNKKSIYEIFSDFLVMLQSSLTIDLSDDATFTFAVAEFLDSPALGPLLIVLIVTSSILIAVIRKKNKEIREINTSNHFIFSRYKELFTHELVTVDYAVQQRKRLEQTTDPVRKYRRSVSRQTHFEQFQLHLY